MGRNNNVADLWRLIEEVLCLNTNIEMETTLAALNYNNCTNTNENTGWLDGSKNS